MAIGHRETGAWSSLSNGFSPVIPTTQAVGDMMLCLIGGKPYDAAATVGTAGWELLTTFTDGTVAVSGADTGSMFVKAYWKVATADPETNPSIAEGSPAFDVVGALVMCFSKAAGETWNVPVMVGGGDATAGTGFSVTANANPGITAGDHVVSWAAFRSDAATPCTSHLVQTATGATFSNTHDPATDPETTTGFDMGMCYNRATLTGTASTAPVLAATIAAAHTGSAALIRLRVSPPVYEALRPDVVSYSAMSRASRW